MARNRAKDTAARGAKTRHNMTDIEHGGADTSDEQATRQVRTNPISADPKARFDNPPRHEFASWSDEQLRARARDLDVEGHEQMSREALVEALRRVPGA